MKSFKRALLFIGLLSLIFSFSALAETATDEDARLEQLKATHEEFVLNAMMHLVQYSSDDATQNQLIAYFYKESYAWTRIAKFDRGWFTATNSRVFENKRAENWKWISDTCFSVDVYCDYTVKFKYANVTTKYPCAYNFTCELVSESRNLWRVTSFHNLPCETYAQNAARLNELYEGISVHAITGENCYGYMLIIDDPSRVYVGGLNWYGSQADGLRIDAMCEKHEALGGINGGGFSDTAGDGTGGEPYGLVVQNSELRRYHAYSRYDYNVIVGFDKDDKMVVVKHEMPDVSQLNLRDALAFAPVLVSDGATVDNKEFRNNISTRTAIGQDAEGRVLMLAVMGRQPNSLGANMYDLSKIMIEFGALVAGNMDGGTSTTMYLGGESVYSGYPLDISRRIPTAFLIKAE